MSAATLQPDQAQPVDPLAPMLALVRVLASGDIRPENAGPVVAQVEQLARDAMSGPAAAVTALRRVQIATAAASIACDAAVVREHIEEVIGRLLSGGGEGLAGLVVQVGRMGLMADAISRAAGGSVWRSDPLGWVLPSDGTAGAVAQLQEGGAA